MRRRAFILILASMVSFLATQAGPARVQRAGDSYAIVWQSENRVRHPAPTSTIPITSQCYGSASHILPEPVGCALQRSSLSVNLRAPPLFISQI
jgi:hypothetical protein